MTQPKRTPEEQQVLDRLRRGNGIEGTEELCLEQARAMGVLPQPGQPELEPLTDEELDDLSRELFHPDFMLGLR